MRISAITKTFIAPLLIMGTASCADNRPEIDRISVVKERSMEYLTAEELLNAENKEPSASIYNTRSLSPQIAYWDSILTSHTLKQAYAEGQQSIQDSIAGKKVKDNPYQNINFSNVDRIEMRLKSELIENAAKFYNAKEFINLRNNEPNANPQIIEASDPIVLHYWNLIERSGAARKAYEDGANAERAKLNE